MGFSELLGTIGGMGNFQILQIALMFIPGMLFTSQNLVQNFSALVPAHHCWLENQTSDEFSLLENETDLLQVSIPMDKNGKPERCLRFTDPQGQLLNLNATEQASLDTEDCLDGWVYDKSVVSSSIVTEWDLVCGKRSLIAVAQMMFQGGIQAGNIIFGILSDRFGRRTVLLWSSLMATIFGTFTAFVPTFTGYAILRFLSGMTFVGSYLTRHCLTIEWTPTDKEILVSTWNGYATTLGQMLLAGLAYLVREWRWLQFSISIAFGIPFLLVLALPESAHWLITHNKCDVAVKTLQKVAWINGHMDQGRKLTPEEIMSYTEEDLTTVKSRITLKDLFQTQAIRKTTLCLLFAWFATGFSYYGTVLDLQKFGFSIYLVQVLFAVIDFPARLLAAIGMSCIGQRLTFIFLAVFSGCMIIIGIFVPQDMAALRLTLGMFGKGSLVGMIVCLRFYSLKFFPTEIRQKGMSTSGLGAAIGSLLAPLVFIIGSYVPILQPLIFGIMPILSAIVASLLFETQGLPLLDTIQETENRWKRAQSLRRNANQDVQERPALLVPEIPQVESTV